MEALGGIVSQSGVASADRATITIDLSQEPRRSAPASEDRKAEPKKKGKKR